MSGLSSLISACGSSESKSRAEALTSLLEALQQQNSRFVEVPELAELCATLAASFVDNNVKVSGGAAAVAERLGGALAPGALRDSLSSFKVPRRIIFITHDDVPRTATGKIKLFETAHMIASHIGAPTPAKATG